MIDTYEERRGPIKAKQLTPETVDEVLEWTLGYLLTPDRWDPAGHCWEVGGLCWHPQAGGPYFDHPSGCLIVGLRTRNGEAIAYERDWLVQPYGNGGGFTVVSPDRFNDLYRVPQ